MKILVFGRTGQVATELSRRVPEGVMLTQLGRDQADLTDLDAVTAAIAASDADAIINAAAYTAVDLAEQDEVIAAHVNGAAPGAMARAAALKGVPFCHVSTDYVFDGSGDIPWVPDAPTGPLGAYGRTKLRGEEEVRGAGGIHAILRTSWVFSAHGSNFVKTMLRLSKTRSRLKIVSDQVGGPTAAADVADALLTIAATFVRGRGRSGTYHFAGSPDISWAGFARETFSRACRRVDVVDMASADYPAPAPRPLNSRLDCRSLETVFGIARPDWRPGLSDALKELEG